MLAAILPSHHEPPAPELIERILAHVDTVLLVDDGSPERSARELDRLGEDERCTVLRLASNQGKGHALAAGLRHLLSTASAPDTVVLLDADGQHPPERIPEFLAAAERAELVVGDRLGETGAMPRRRRFGNRLVSRALALLTGRPVRDSQCGMRLLRGRALAVPFPGGGYEAETLHLKRCLRDGVTVAWVPIPSVYAGERSSFRELRDTVRVALALLR